MSYKLQALWCNLFLLFYLYDMLEGFVFRMSTDYKRPPYTNVKVIIYLLLLKHRGIIIFPTTLLSFADFCEINGHGSWIWEFLSWEKSKGNKQIISSMLQYLFCKIKDIWNDSFNLLQIIWKYIFANNSISMNISSNYIEWQNGFPRYIQ